MGTLGGFPNPPAKSSSRRSRLSLTRAVGLIAVLIAGCGYSPNPEPGGLKCGPGGSCPEGYSCSLSGACWRSDVDPNDFLGCWPYEAGSTQQLDCSDGFSETTDLHDIADWIEITAGAPLATHYYCSWKLRLPGRTTAFTADQSCTSTDPDTGTTFKYHGERFAFSTSDGMKARLEASIPYEASDATGPIGSCTMRITGTLTRADAAACVVPVAAPPTEN